MNISKHFTMDDVQFNEMAIRYGIDNELPDDLYENAECLAEELLEPLYEKHKGIIITSWYRSEALEREYCRHSYLKWCVANRVPINEYSWRDYLDIKPHVRAQAVTLRYTEEIFNTLKGMEFTTLQKKDWISVSYIKGQLHRRVIE